MLIFILFKGGTLLLTAMMYILPPRQAKAACIFLMVPVAMTTGKPLSNLLL